MSGIISDMLGHSIAMETTKPLCAPDSPEAQASRDQQVMSPTPPGFETPEQIELKRRLVGKQNPRRGGSRARSSNEGGDGETMSGQGAQVKALTDMVLQLQEQIAKMQVSASVQHQQEQSLGNGDSSCPPVAPPPPPPMPSVQVDDVHHGYQQSPVVDDWSTGGSQQPRVNLSQLEMRALFDMT